MAINPLLERTRDVGGTASARRLLIHAWIAGVLTAEELTAVAAFWSVLWSKPTTGSPRNMPIDIEVECDSKEPISAGLVMGIKWMDILIDGVHFGGGQIQSLHFAGARSRRGVPRSSRVAGSS